MNAPTLYVTCGFPAAGKSTWATMQARGRNTRVVTVDALRLRHVPGWQVFRDAYLETTAALEAGQSVIFDSCALRASERNTVRVLGARAGVRCECVVFCVSWSVCRARDRARGSEAAGGNDHTWAERRSRMARALLDVAREPWSAVRYVPQAMPASQFIWCY